MTFAIITHVPHFYKNENFYAYAPYVREMNVWGKYVDNIELVASISKKETSSIHLPYTHSAISITKIPSISLTSYSEIIKTVVAFPIIFFKLFLAMRRADHIHLRCPGNIGLIGCMVQVLFPNKLKTAKYAGNWDPKAKQPLSYRIQKWILSNTFLTKNMKVLVYGDWGGASKNVVSFFTATYRESEKVNVRVKPLNGMIKLLFVGTLGKGKRPMLTVRTVMELLNAGFNVCLDVYGEGEEQGVIETFIVKNNLENNIILHGNKNKDVLKVAYQRAHFLIFMSKSEGWPKVIAEAAFFGCLTISTAVSCIPHMLNYGKRGAIVEPEIKKIVSVVESYLLDEKKYNEQVEMVMEWSKQFTMEKFDNEISKLINT